MSVRLEPLASVPRIRVLDDPPRLSPSLEQRVGELWREATSGSARPMTDGRIFSLLDEAVGSRMAGGFVPYRYFIAQRMDPRLRTVLAVRPLAVTCLVECGNAVVIGRRGAGVTQDPGRWEIIPAGGVDPDCRDESGFLDLSVQVRKELQEEIGVELPAGAILRPLAWMTDDGVTDLVFSFQLSLRRRDITVAFERLTQPEHTAIDFVEFESLENGSGSEARSLTMTTRALLEAFVRAPRRPAGT